MQISSIAKNQVVEMLDKAILNKELAGANVLVFHHNEEVLYHEAGYATIEEGKQIRRDTIFRLYSMTKPVTAVATMMLVERGLIDLYDSVEKYLPGFKCQKVVVDDNLVDPKRQVNIMDLLAMTSGLLYGGDNVTGKKMYEFWMELDQKLLTPQSLTTLEAMNAIGQIPLAFHPGEAWEYGSSADVLGAIIEVVAQKKFGQFLREELFLPLGMKDTAFYVEEEKRERLVTTYERCIEQDQVILKPYRGNHLGIINAMDREPTFESGGAGLVSTIDDYAKFAQMLMKGGLHGDVQILRPQSVDYLTRRVLTNEQQHYFENWHTLAGHSYGSLMRVVTDPSKAGTITSHGEYGWDGWLGAYFANCPTDNVTLLFMMQMKDAGTTATTRKLRNIILSELVETK